MLQYLESSSVLYRYVWVIDCVTVVEVRSSVCHSHGAGRQDAANALNRGAQALIFGGLLDSRELRDNLRVQSAACGGIYREWAEVPHISHREPRRGPS